jgi:hypothetical protein
LTEKKGSFRAEAALYYLATTERVAEPPELLRTVMFCGFVARVNWPMYFPPLFVSVPISCPLVVTKACSVAVERVLVASTRKVRFAVSYCASVMLTVSTGVDAGLSVSVAVRVAAFKVALIVTLAVEATDVVAIVKLAFDAPAATVTLAGREASALPDERLTLVGV